MDITQFLYGKNPTQNVVSVEMTDGEAILYCEKDGQVYESTLEAYHWLLYDKPYTPFMKRLKGESYYNYGVKFRTEADWRRAQYEARENNWDIHCIYNTQEMMMIKEGVTYYKGMAPSDVSILSFDIETTALDPKEGICLMITNTFRKNGNIIRRTFSYDQYKSQKDLVGDWAAWVRDIDPSILCGHNIFNFDIPFLVQCAGGTIDLGRGNRPLRIAKYKSQFRKDGSQSYDYNNCIVPGREVIDTFHLAIKYDIGRNYPSYGLKPIIKFEGLEAADRQHYDASQIRVNYTNPAEWAKIKKYAEHDADDALSLFDLMIPSFFYYCQSIPKTLQQIINGASGAQVDAFMKRSYLQQGYGLPVTSEVESYEGATSYGNPGLYLGVRKVDVASLYPSIIRQYKIYDPIKDPQANFLRMVEIFTEERLKNKALAKETGDRRYKDMEQSQKIMINSAYGFMGAAGLLFNSPKNAASVTRHGRQILQKGIDWATGNGFSIVNVDTDSFSYIGSPVPFDQEIEDLNSIFPELIKWENDGIYDKVLVVATKNYVLVQDGKAKIKGSALKASMKEPRLQDFIKYTIDNLLNADPAGVLSLYDSYVNEIQNHIDKSLIAGWCSKKTVTKSVLKPKRTTEQRILDAIGKHPVSEGDKIRVFYADDDRLALKQDFDGNYSKKRLFRKLYDTVKIFESVLDISEFLNYSLVRNMKLLSREAS